MSTVKKITESRICILSHQQHFKGCVCIENYTVVALEDSTRLRATIHLDHQFYNGTRHVSVHISVYESLTSKTISCSDFRYQRGLATDCAAFISGQTIPCPRSEPATLPAWRKLVGGDPRRQYTNREPEHSTNGFPEEWRE
jgi:hypothetical protein